MDAEEKSQYKRCFIAADISDASRAAIKQRLKPLQQQYPDDSLRWLPPQNWHLTLCFLGNTALATIDTIQDLLPPLVSSIAPFDIIATHITAFPNPKRAHVIALTIAPSEPLTNLAKITQLAVSKADHPPEKRGFKPHLTVARIKRKMAPHIEQDISQQSLRIPIGSITLYESNTYPEGAQYTPLLTIRL